MQNLNSKDWPEVYSCKFLEAGIVSYEDSGAGIALLKKETIDKMAHTFIGRPVIIDHQNVTPENYEKVAVGYVTNVRFSPEDAWFYADFIITDDKARALIDEQGYSVSCAYNVLDVAEGGLWHDIKFDGEITDGSFTHLALVNSPRYEDSKITKQLPAMLVNGKAAHYLNNKEEGKMSIFKLFKKQENTKQEDAPIHVALNDKAVPLADVLLYCLNGKALTFEGYSASNDAQKYVAQDSDIVDMNGNTVTIGELKACYHMKSENEKKNSDDEKKKEEEAKNAKEEEEKKKEEEAKNAKEEEEKKAKEEEEKKNAAAEEEKKKEEEKQNSKARSDKFFLELSNANKSFDALENESSTPAPKTRAERAAAFRAKTNKKV